MKFLSAPAFALFLVASAIAAQAWTFAETESGSTVTWANGVGAKMEMACTRTGAPGGAEGTVIWRLETPGLPSAADLPDGTMAEVALAFDGEGSGKGPFVRQGSTLATRIENTSPILTRLRSARDLGIGVGGNSMTVPLSGFETALVQMMASCAKPAQTTAGRGIEATCAAPDTDSARTICASPALRAIEDELEALVTQRGAALSGLPREAFITDQTAWNGLRQSCAANAECLSTATRGRIAFLQRQTGAPAPAPAAEPAPAETVAATTTEAAAPPPLEIPAVQPLQPAQLGAALYDHRQISQRVIMEAIRRQPLLLENGRILESWYRITIGAGKNPQGPAEMALARDHLSRSVAAQPPGPFLIAFDTVNPFANATYDQGVLELNAYGRKTQNIGRFDVPINGLGNLVVRATSQYDISRLQVGAAQAEAMLDRYARLLVVAQINAIHVSGTPGSIFTPLAEGQVRFAGLKRVDPPQPHGNPKPLRQLNPGLLIANFGPTPPTPPQGGLAALADELDIAMHDGAVLERSAQGQGGDFNTLIRLASLRANPPARISPALRAFAFNTLADPAERDQVIPPINIENYNNAQNLNLSRHVDEFERAELEDRIDQLLWPRVLARLPKAPFEGIMVLPATLGEYERDFGGFLIEANVNSMGLSARGDYPALKSLPELLHMPVEKARELVNYFDTSYGPGRRPVTLVLRYRIADIGPVVWENNRELPVTSIEPLSLSLHASPQTPDGDPLALKITDFDLKPHLGTPPPMASSEQVAFWKDILEVPRSTADDVTLAALGVSDTEAYREAVIEGSNRIRSTNAFDQPAARAAMRADLAALPKPGKMILTGTLQMSGYDLEQEVYRATQLRLGFERGEMGLPAPAVQLSQSDLLSQIEMELGIARIFAGDGQSSDATARLVAWVEPDLLTFERGRPVLYVRATRIVLVPGSSDLTGYPPAHLDIAIPDITETIATDVPVAQLTVDPPSSLPIDSEYIDLLMVRAEGDALDEDAYLRMLDDRRQREQKAAEIGYDVPWGNFFSTLDGDLNPSQRRAMLPSFVDWTKKRAQLLPQNAYLQTPAQGMVPAALQCWTLRPTPANANYVQSMPNGLAGALRQMEYEKQAVNLSTVQRSVGNGLHRLPKTIYTIYGRPSLAGTGRVRVDTATNFCAPQRRSSQRTEAPIGAHWNAIVVVDGAFRAPLSRDKAQMFRDIGQVTVSRVGPDTVRLDVSTQRTEIMDVTGTADNIWLNRTGMLNDDSLPQPPEVRDLFGVSPGDNWDASLATAQERLPEARIAKSDGPPQNFRQVTQNTILGPMPEFTALRNGHVFFDPQGNEVLALLREAERDPERVLAVGSYRRFNAASVQQEQLIGALLQKYGPAPETNSEEGMRGPRPGQSLAWGARAGCIPRMNDELRPDWSGLAQNEALREMQNIARVFRAPSLTYNGAHSVIYERCSPMVWAFVGEDQAGTVHLMVWSLDMALLNEVAQMPDTTLKADGEDGSQALIENAAEIDL